MSLKGGARPPASTGVQAAILRGKPTLAKTVEQRKIERENMLLLNQLDRVRRLPCRYGESLVREERGALAPSPYFDSH